MDTAGRAPRPLHRPLPATLAPTTARALVAYLDLEPEQSLAWLRERCRSDEARVALDDDLERLRYVAGWQRAWLASDVGHDGPPVSDIARGSVHDEITTAEVAREFGVNPRTVRRWVDGGLLIGRRVNARSVMVSRASVKALIEARAA